MAYTTTSVRAIQATLPILMKFENGKIKCDTMLKVLATESRISKNGHMLGIYGGHISNVERCPDLSHKLLKKKERQS